MTNKERTEMTMQIAQHAVANPRIKVIPVEKGIGHYYQGFWTKTGEEIGTFKSVTGVLDIIGGGKTFGLMHWAKTEALKRYAELLTMRVETAKLSPLDPEWMKWAHEEAHKEPKKILREAADLGTRVHLAIDAYITNTLPETMDEDVKIPFNNFMQFVFEHDIKFICGDLAIMSAKYKVGGRMDALAMVDGILTLLDWKTANGIRDDVALQIGGYNKGMKETLGIGAKRGITVRFGKENAKEFETKEVNLAKAESAFLHAVRLSKTFSPKLIWRKDGEKQKDNNKSE